MLENTGFRQEMYRIRVFLGVVVVEMVVVGYRLGWSGGYFVWMLVKYV